jgi:polyphosphate kinase
MTTASGVVWLRPWIPNLFRQYAHSTPANSRSGLPQKLPKRQKRGGYREPDYPFKFIKERY